MKPMLAGPGGLGLKDGRWTLVRSWDPELLREHISLPAFLREDLQEREGGPAPPEPGTHSEKVRMLEGRRNCQHHKMGTWVCARNHVGDSRLQEPEDASARTKKKCFSRYFPQMTTRMKTRRLKRPH